MRTSAPVHPDVCCRPKSKVLSLSGHPTYSLTPSVSKTAETEESWKVRVNIVKGAISIWTPHIPLDSKSVRDNRYRRVLEGACEHRQRCSLSGHPIYPLTLSVSKTTDTEESWKVRVNIVKGAISIWTPHIPLDSKSVQDSRDRGVLEGACEHCHVSVWASQSASPVSHQARWICEDDGMSGMTVSSGEPTWLFPFPLSNWTLTPMRQHCLHGWWSHFV